MHCEYVCPLKFNLCYLCLECINLAEQSEVPVLNSNMPDSEDGVTYENQEEAIAMSEELPVIEEMTLNQPNGIDSCCLAGAYGTYLAF